MSHILSARDECCEVHLDRVLLTSWAPAGWAPPRFASLKIVRDHMLRTSMYQRVREYVDPKTGCRIFWQYRRRRPWVARWRINIIGGKDGLTYEELKTVLSRCRYHQIGQVEVAIDFTGKVDQNFVKRYAVFGKSHPRITPYNDTLYYGCRKGRKFIRCYQKDELNAFRIELQLNSRMLRAELTSRQDQLGSHADVPITLQQLSGVISKLVPADFTFVKLSGARLQEYVEGKYPEKKAKAIIHKARLQAYNSLHSACAYLRSKRVKNIHRLRVPLRLNRRVRHALEKWCAEFHDPEIRFVEVA